MLQCTHAETSDEQLLIVEAEDARDLSQLNKIRIPLPQTTHSVILLHFAGCEAL